MDNSGWRQKLDQYKFPIGLFLLGTVLIIGGIFASGPGRAKAKSFPKESLVSAEKMISVDVSGAVNKPGVYQLKEGARIADAVSSAGGVAEGANAEYISKYLNMAQKLSDGSKVYVPFKGEEGTLPIGGVGTSVAGKVNINTASQAELEALSGIGPVTASRIISDRPYQVVDDLLSKKIISKPVFEKIKDLISLY